MMETLFKNFNPVPEKTRTETCRSCIHRERWHFGSKIIQYCGVLSSNRTNNKKLKITCNKTACDFYKPEGTEND
ncbi:MAG: hypothetical protein DRH26_14180 [Deltaproteobacteria bacterium]|nr:MAG: hypothetical protein DRH26_14180 [Deltaproteobacteria bacterium]